MSAAVEEDPSLCDESSDDSLEELKELESKLYSVIHYNDLSETIPSDLPCGFEIELDKSSNEIIVSLKNEIISVDSKIVNDESIKSHEFQTLVKNCSKKSSDVCNMNVSESVVNTSNNVLLNNDESITASDTVDGKPCDKQTINDDDDDDDEVMIIETSTVKSVGLRDKNDKTVCIDLVDTTDNTSENSFLSIDINTNIKLFGGESFKALDNHMKSQKTNNENNFVINSKPTLLDKTNIEVLIVSSDEENSKEGVSCSSDKNNKVKIKKKKKLEKHCPKKWTQSMIKFYSKISRKKLNFDSMKLIKKMKETTSARQWFVSDKDLNRNLYNSRKQRCRRCRQYDHDIKHCREAIKPIVCYMCGESGHRESRCPYRKCLTCGQPSGVFVQMCSKCTKDKWKKRFHCPFCYSNHGEDLCPNVWRSFHMTTKTGPLVVPLSRSKLKRCCCNCGKSGHLDYECKEINNSVYIVERPFVNDYISIAQLFTTCQNILTIILRLTSKEGDVLESDSGNDFLQNLSNATLARLELLDMPHRSLTVIGTQSQCKAVTDGVYSFVAEHINNNSTSFHKHKKKQSPYKKQKIT
ncbi:uncharacterized protein LOC142322058 isoform X2 [Lycorma delicatula]